MVDAAVTSRISPTGVRIAAAVLAAIREALRKDADPPLNGAKMAKDRPITGG